MAQALHISGAVPVRPAVTQCSAVATCLRRNFHGSSSDLGAYASTSSLVLPSAHGTCGFDGGACNMLQDMSVTVTNWLTAHFYSFFFTLIVIVAAGSGILVAMFGEPARFGAKKIFPRLAGLRFPILRSLTILGHFLDKERIAFIFILGILFSAYGVLLIAWESFISSDDMMFFPSLTNSPQWIYPPIWPTFGRFFPLGHQEFYPLSLLNNSVTFYQLFAAIEMAILLLLVVRILNGSFAISIVTCVAIMMTPGIVKVLLSRIDPERNILVLLAILMFGAVRYRENGSITAFILTSMASVAILFCKETGFILVGGWGLMLIILVQFSATAMGPVSCRRLRLLAIPPLVGSFVWLFLYLFAIYPQIQASYAADMQRPLTEVLGSLYQIWIFMLFLALLVRFSILRSEKLDPVWDGWLLPIFGSVGAYALLQFSAAYYTAPAAFLSWLYVGHVAQLWSLRASGYKHVALSIASLAIFCGAMLQVPASFSVLSNRKEFIASRTKAAEFVYHFAVSRNAISGLDSGLTLHFDQDPYRWAHYDAALFAGYLEARYGLSKITVGMPANALGTRTERCVFWMELIAITD